MSEYKTVTDRNVQVQLDLIEKQMAYMEAMMRPTAAITHKTLRDQFAMAALTGILMNDNLLPGNTELIPYLATGRAYEIADAMMEARK